MGEIPLYTNICSVLKYRQGISRKIFNCLRQVGSFIDWILKRGKNAIGP